MAIATEASLLSEKCGRFGVLGAGLVPDSLMTLRLAEARESASASSPVASKSEPEVEAVSNSYINISKEVGADGSLTREQILEILKETVRVQGIVQQEVSVLARKLAKEKGERKKKKEKLSFLDGHKKILELDLPREPLEDFALTESAFQRLLQDYERDDEVMHSAQRLLHPCGKGDPQRAAGINMDKIIEIHRFMVGEMEKVLHEFLALPEESRRSFTGKGCETTAELLVSIAVEQQLSVRCEDVEQAVIRYEEELQGHPDFTRYTEQLANMMQHLIGAAQPRVQKSEFLSTLREMGDSTKKAKAFAKQLYEEYRAKTCNIAEAYRRFNSFSEECAASLAEGASDLSSVELQLCYDEYKADDEVKKAWEDSGVESNLMMQAALSPMLNGSTKASTSPIEGPKGKKLKPSDIVEMQELMVDEMKRATEQAMFASRDRDKSEGPWRAEITIQLVQALASAAVERRYGTSAEDMTIAGFQHAAILQRNERFARASEKQQEILMMLARLCGQGQES